MNRTIPLALCGLLAISMLTSGHAIQSNAALSPTTQGPVEGLERLLNGNRRFVRGESQTPNRSIERRQAVAGKQNPFAAIVTCSDSRLTPEFIFDQGIGDLFVVRLAGNTVDPIALGSLEFAIQALGANLVVVMGHERCGAVEAALKGGSLPGNLPAVVAPIKPACEGVEGADALNEAIRKNVELVAKHIAEENPVTAELRKTGKIQVVGMTYDLDTGEVTVTSKK